MHPSRRIPYCGRWFSDTGVSSELEPLVAEQEVIVRHSQADSVVNLNVGGKEFVTLRSTLQCNPVLYERVLKAEANNEFVKGAVFVDRDPAQFPTILQHLRNVADSITLSSHSMQNLNVLTAYSQREVNIQIPQDTAQLRELFVEARYYQIKELEALLCTYDWGSWLASLFGGSTTNPFHQALQVAKTARATLLTTSGLGILIGGAQNDWWTKIAAVIGIGS